MKSFRLKRQKLSRNLRTKFGAPLAWSSPGAELFKTFWSALAPSHRQRLWPPFAQAHDLCGAFVSYAPI
jgi:hypothetical protein